MYICISNFEKNTSSISRTHNYIEGSSIQDPTRKRKNIKKY